MSAANNPPQLQLSLGHQTFKRSFTQFGLDIDDGEDSRSDSSSANASSGSLSGSSNAGNASGSGSGPGSSGTRSVSSGSSYSSAGAVDGFGYNDGERSERNKRARSEGPEREAVSVSVSAASSSSAESSDAASISSLSSSDGSLLDPSPSQNPSPRGQGSPQQTNASISNYNTTSGFTLPVLDFGPSTPSVAEFVALRSGSLDPRTAENPPGFANMLSPRSSSPAPPPAVEIDVAMRDDNSDEDPFPSLGSSHTGRQNFGTNTSMNSGFLDTARSDALLNSATERLRSAMERARTFDRALAPLRSDAADGLPGSSSHQQGFSRPRLPPFDFESQRRTSSYRVPQSTSSIPGLSNPLYRLTQFPSNVTDLDGSTSPGRSLSTGAEGLTGGRSSLTPLSSSVHFDVDDDEDIDSEEEGDSIIVDRELTVEPDLPNTNRSLAFDNLPSGSESSRSPSLNRAHPSENAGRLDISGNTTNSLTDRALDDLTSFILTSETEDAGTPIWLRPTLPSSRLSLEMSGQSDNSTPGLSGADQPRWRSRPNTTRTAGRDREQEEEARSEANIDRFRGWPWNDLLGPPATELSIPGLGPRSNSETQPSTETQQESPRSPFFQLSSLPSPRSNEGLYDAESEMRRIERMVEMDMETNSQSRFTSPNRRLPPPLRSRGEDPMLNRLRAFGTSQNQNGAQRSSPARRPNLPTLRSAILGPLRNSNDDRPGSFSDLLRRDEWQTDRIDRGPSTQTSTSGVATSMAGPSPRSRGMIILSNSASCFDLVASSNAITAVRGNQPTRWTAMLNTEGQPRERAAGGQRDLPTSVLDRRPGEEHMPSPLSSSHIRTGASTAPSSTRTSQTVSNFEPSRALRRDREISHEATERNRQFLQNWFPPIYEAERLQDTELRTRLREMRDQHRLSVPPRPLFRNRQEHPTQPQIQDDRLDVLRWADSWDEALQSTAASSSIETDLFGPVRPVSDPPRTQPYPNDGTSDAPVSSSESAAYFASGPSFGPSRQAPGRSSPSVLRRRFRPLSELYEDRTASVPGLDLLREPWEDFEMNLDPSDTYGFGGDHISSTHRSRDFNIPTPSDEMIQLIYSGDLLLQDAPASQRQVNSGSSDLGSARRASNETDLDDLPPLEESRVRTWNSISIQSPPHRAPATITSETPRRSLSLRDTSRPPSLPPLHFQRLSALPPDTSDGADSRSFGIQDSSAHHGAPWRRPQSERQTDSQAVNTPRGWRSGDLALHHAMVLRSVQARQPNRDTSHGSDYTTLSVTPRMAERAEGFQQATNVLGSDALPGSLRHHFDRAFNRELDQGRSNPARNDTQTHVHWGELRNDNADSRLSAHTTARPWSETQFRRRRSMSSLFAPPPENADTTPPNRTRGAGPAGGDPHAHASGSDWLDAFSSANRVRVRHRARLARLENEPASRAFFRFGRNRPGLRNFGDFIRDEDFDTSYESLLALASTVGEVKPRSTPAHVINALPTGLYKDWQSPGGDTRCPICLDDYKDADVLLKAEPCKHWCHKECFEQWLHTAQTCPVCRTKIRPPRRSTTPPSAAGPSRLIRAENLQDMVDDSDDDYSFLSSSPNRAFFEYMLPTGRPPRAPRT
ncbi:hypothetical protein ACEPAH_7497 [Sanghuangporus vaninii]